MTTIERVHAWDQLGTTVTGAMDAATALERAKLANWNVRKEPMYLANGDLVPNHFANVRDNPTDGSLETMGVVGNHYASFQNESMTEMLDAITDESGAHYETAGIGQGGKQVFVTMKMPQAIKVGGIDPVDLYLAALNSHDGNSSFKFIITPVRIACANMQTAAVNRAVQKFTRRHTVGGTGVVIQQAREALGMTFEYLEDFEREAQKMIEAEYTNQAFSRLTASLLPTPKDATDRVEATKKGHRQALSELFTNSPTNKAIRGTRWAAYQAVTEYLDHYVVQRGKAGDVLREARANQATNPDSDHNAMKHRAWDLLMVK